MKGAAAKGPPGMSFAREKRLMLTWLLMAGPIPMPFTQSLEWPVLFLYELALVYFLQRVEQERPPVLPNWVLNVLALVYLPLLAVDLKASFDRSRPVAALMHLVMFLGVVKLYSLRREKDKWLVFVAAFFLFVGSMATSTHVAVVVYLLGYSLLVVLALARFAQLHMVTAHRRRTVEPEGGPVPGRPLPFRGLLLAGNVLVVLIAIPTFAALPRLRDPFLLGPGGGTSLIRASGFSDSVDLSLTSSIRGNRAVALRIRYLDDFAPDDAAELRIKGATYDVYDDRRWHRRFGYARIVEASRDGRSFELLDEPVVGEVEIFRERLNSAGLLLPMEAVGFELKNGRLPAVGVDLGGAVYLPRDPRSTVVYTVQLASGPRFAARLEAPGTEPVSPYTALDQGGVTPRMRQLARDVMGEGSAEERVARLESHLLSEYAYTVDFIGREGDAPVEEFLFEDKSGHCELFATAMVLLLRAEGIPARFAAGFLGGEYNPLEGYYIVRQQNAHAWVEAYVEGSGWRVYDPTPPEGRPTIPEPSVLNLASQVYDYLYFRWDRYVLTYGAEDQRDIFGTLQERLKELWDKIVALITVEEQEEEASTVSGGVRAPGGDTVRERQLWLSQVPIAVAISLFVAGLGVLLWWQRRSPLTAGGAYRQLRRLLARTGLAVSDTLAPLALMSLMADRFPSADAPARRLTALYLRESFAEESLSDGERAELKPSLAAVREAVRSDLKRGRPGK